MKVRRHVQQRGHRARVHADEPRGAAALHRLPRAEPEPQHQVQVPVLALLSPHHRLACAPRRRPDGGGGGQRTEIDFNFAKFIEFSSNFRLSYNHHLTSSYFFFGQSFVYFESPSFVGIAYLKHTFFASV